MIFVTDESVYTNDLVAELVGFVEQLRDALWCLRRTLGLPSVLLRLVKIEGILSQNLARSV